MVERRPFLDFLTHAVLILGIVVVVFPVYLTFVASTLTAEEVLDAPMTLVPGSHLIENYRTVLFQGVGEAASPVSTMMKNSLIMALGIALGKIAISIISAFAIVYFRFPLRKTFFWLIFITLMLPVEVRIIPTYKVVADLGLIDTYAGLTIPLIASATATLLFRQFFLTIPDELVEAAKIDGEWRWGESGDIPFKNPTDRDRLWLIDFVARQVVRLERAYPEITSMGPEYAIERDERVERARMLPVKLRHISEG